MIALLASCLLLVVPTTSALQPVRPFLAPTRGIRALPSPRCSAGDAPTRGGLRLLEWIPSQKLLVGTARFVWTNLWLAMLSELAPQSPEGAYVRPAPQTGSGAEWPAHLPMSRGRYHVYVGNACPWCHRVTLALALRGQLDVDVTCTVLSDDPQRASRGGWYFDPDRPDPLCGAADLKAVYDACTEGGSYTGRCTAPLLVDLQTSSIISNESADIVRMLNSLDVTTSADAPADERAGKPDRPPRSAVVELYPAQLASQIEETNQWVYEQVNNGVYRAGFATRQAAYERAEADVHDGLERCDRILGSSRFLCGELVTEADVRLLPTALRFDGVYAAFFRCGRRQIRSDYPHVERWMREMLSLAPQVGSTFDLDGARASYYTNLFPLNPGGVVPAGPSMTDLGLNVEARPVLDTTAFAWRDLPASV